LRFPRGRDEFILTAVTMKKKFFGAVRARYLMNFFHKIQKGIKFFLFLCHNKNFIPFSQQKGFGE
jgi:hypothetical protein